jgi:hypothetical protein
LTFSVPFRTDVLLLEPVDVRLLPLVPAARFRLLPVVVPSLVGFRLHSNLRCRSISSRSVANSSCRLASSYINQDDIPLNSGVQGGEKRQFNYLKGVSVCPILLERGSDPLRDELAEP